MIFGRATSLLSLVFVTVALLTAGCSQPQADVADVQINKLATWFQYFRTQHRGKAPKDEDQLVDFILKEYEGAPQQPDMDEILISPRDGQKYVVMYGAKQLDRVNLENNLACYEAEGVDGMRYVAFESAWKEVLDQAALDAILEKY